MDDRIARWEARPDLPPTHYVDNRIFTDPAIFDDEQARIFAGGWKLVCHESELPEAGSYRALTLGGRPILVVRGRDQADGSPGDIRAFFNICPHRGAPRPTRWRRGRLADRAAPGEGSDTDVSHADTDAAIMPLRIPIRK
jgi:nitrite reductase/ring-hydroxylating ferredoxin subunit